MGRKKTNYGADCGADVPLCHRCTFHWCSTSLLWHVTFFSHQYLLLCYRSCDPFKFYNGHYWFIDMDMDHVHSRSWKSQAWIWVDMGNLQHLQHTPYFSWKLYYCTLLSTSAICSLPLQWDSWYCEKCNRLAKSHTSKSHIPLKKWLAIHDPWNNSTRLQVKNHWTDHNDQGDEDKKDRTT